MSRVSLIEQLYAPKKKSALEFNYDSLWAPPIRFLLSQQDINELYKIATSLKYNDNIQKKYELIDAIMKPRGFKRGNCGTNRVVYNFLEDTSFCMKIALDRVGIQDSPKEYKNQEFFKPFCCKIFEVDPTGVIACVERVNPISSLEEFISIADDVFNMMVTKIIGKYVVDDLGTEKFLNYGLRMHNGISFGPVILDYPYAYELDGAKLHCCKPIQIGDKEFACGGEIDYDAGLNNLVCCKCGRTYSARELAKDDSNVLKYYADGEQHNIRAKIVRMSDGTIIKDSGRSSKLYITQKEYEEGITMFKVESLDPRPVAKTIDVKSKRIPMNKLREQYYSELQVKAYEEMQKKASSPFNTVIESELSPRPAVRAENIKEEIVTGTVVEKTIDDAVTTEEQISENETVETNNQVEISESSEETMDISEQIIDAIHALMPNLSISKETLEDILERNNYNYEDVIKELQELNEESSNDDESDNEETKIDNSEEDTQTTDEVSIEAFNQEIESEAFPEINNSEIIVGVDLSETTDYSNYIPPEETDEDESSDVENDEYDYDYSEDRKEAKRNNKKQQNKNKKSSNDEDMSDY